MTDTELLAATGNVWSVTTYRDGNCRKTHRRCHIRAATKQGAIRTAQRLFGGVCGIASPWNPAGIGERMGTYIRLVETEVVS